MMVHVALKEAILTDDQRKELPSPNSVARGASGSKACSRSRRLDFWRTA